MFHKAKHLYFFPFMSLFFIGRMFSNDIFFLILYSVDLCTLEVGIAVSFVRYTFLPSFDASEIHSHEWHVYVLNW